MNKINELKTGQGNIELQAIVTNIGDIRNFEKFGNSGRVCNAIIKDDSGTIKLSLWNDQIDDISEGDEIKIVNGYVSEFRDELQLSTGKFGKLEIIKKNSLINENYPKNNINISEQKESKNNISNNISNKTISEDDEFDFVDIEEEKIE
jgi:replication factor A1